MSKKKACPELVNTDDKKRENLFKIASKRLLKNHIAMAGLIVLLLLIICAIFAPVVTPYNYEEMDPTAINAAPSLRHLFGTDTLGRDVFSRLIYGSRYSLFMGISCSILGLIFAGAIGCIAGYFGGTVDNVIMRCCDIVQAVPGILIAIVLCTAFGNGYINTILAMALGGIAPGVRMTRSLIMSERTNEYVEAARSINCSTGRILFYHMLINISPMLIVNFTMGIGNIIMLASQLSFIGLGIQPPMPEWGAMLSAGRATFRNYPWQIFFPGMFIFITILAINLFGDGLRDALDPKMKE